MIELHAQLDECGSLLLSHYCKFAVSITDEELIVMSLTDILIMAIRYSKYFMLRTVINDVYSK